MLHVKVTQKHIDEGVPGSPRSCAIALAVRDQVNGAVNVSVGANEIYVRDKDYNIARFLLTSEAKTFVSRFDYGGIVHPFEFDAPERKEDEDAY